MEANRDKRRKGIREAVRRGGKQVGDPHRGLRRRGAAIPEERQNLIRGDLGASGRGEREEVGTEVQVLMEERRGGEQSPKQELRFSLQPATPGSGAPLLRVELFRWARNQDTTKTPFPGGMRPPTRISEPKAPVG